jgi:hypothetical protein
VVRIEGVWVAGRFVAQRIDVVLAADGLREGPPPRSQIIEFLIVNL